MPGVPAVIFLDESRRGRALQALIEKHALAYESWSNQSISCVRSHPEDERLASEPPRRPLHASASSAEVASASRTDARNATVEAEPARRTQQS